MGLLNQVRDQFIARPDNSKDQIVYKWLNRNIRKMSNITVEPDEVALFVKGGVVIGTLTHGNYGLSGDDIPFIGGIIDFATGGNFLIGEIYFVSIREFPNLPFGGMLDNVLDPTTNLAVGLRIFGEYSLKVVDAQKLILNLVGTQNLVSNDEITGWTRAQVLKTLRQIVSSHITNDKWEVLGIASKTDILQSETLGQVQAFLLNYGITIAQLGNFTISLDPKDEETLKNMRRDMSYNQNPGLADTALKLGAAQGLSEGSDAGIAGAGIAAGLGLGMANQLQQNSQNNVKCSNCSFMNPVNAKFCENCGNSLVKNA